MSRRFLDAGSGSGLFSLAAYRMGAEVMSFDADPDSVACTNRLRNRFEDPPTWFVREGSLLDKAFLSTLQPADVVYCWGVAHHTGDMWKAIDNLTQLVAPGGLLASGDLQRRAIRLASVARHQTDLSVSAASVAKGLCPLDLDHPLPAAWATHECSESVAFGDAQESTQAICQLDSGITLPWHAFLV